MIHCGYPIVQHFGPIPAYHQQFKHTISTQWIKVPMDTHIDLHILIIYNHNIYIIIYIRYYEQTTTNIPIYGSIFLWPSSENAEAKSLAVAGVSVVRVPTVNFRRPLRFQDVPYQKGGAQSVGT